MSAIASDGCRNKRYWGGFLKEIEALFTKVVIKFFIHKIIHIQKLFVVHKTDIFWGHPLWGIIDVFFA